MRSHKKAAPWGVKETLADVVQTKDFCLIANPGEPPTGFAFTVRPVKSAVNVIWG
jgi:N-acetyl-gamma-glutamylphosphate reductase